MIQVVICVFASVALLIVCAAIVGKLLQEIGIAPPPPMPPAESEIVTDWDWDAWRKENREEIKQLNRDRDQSPAEVRL